MGEGTRTVDERGRVTIPEDLRERLGIHAGDEVVVREDEGRIVIEKPTPEERLAEGYRRRAERDRDLAAEMERVSSEADCRLGDAPGYSLGLAGGP